MPLAGYSGTPLFRKLGLKAGSRMHTIGAPAGYRALLEPLPGGVRFERAAGKTTDIVHLFETDRGRLAATLVAMRQRLGPEAIVWVSWPKKTAGVPTNLTDGVIRDVALPLGFVDVKVCAVNGIWSGLKLVVRKALRNPGRDRAP